MELKDPVSGSKIIWVTFCKDRQPFHEQIILLQCYEWIERKSASSSSLELNVLHLLFLQAHFVSAWRERILGE